MTPQTFPSNIRYQAPCTESLALPLSPSALRSTAVQHVSSAPHSLYPIDTTPLQKLEAITTNLRPGIDAELEGLGLGGGGGASGPAAAGVGAGPGLGLGGLELHVCEAQLIDSLRDEVDRLRAQVGARGQEAGCRVSHWASEP